MKVQNIIGSAFAGLVLAGCYTEPTVVTTPGPTKIIHDKADPATVIVNPTPPVSTHTETHTHTHTDSTNPPDSDGSTTPPTTSGTNTTTTTGG